MRANIAGIQVEGTPEEIIKFRELLANSDTEFKGGVVNVHVTPLKSSAELLSEAFNELKKQGL
jgi:hypothetical protein